MKSTRRALFGLLPFAGVAAAQITDKDGNITAKGSLATISMCKPGDIIRSDPKNVNGFTCTEVMQVQIDIVRCAECHQIMWYSKNDGVEGVECITGSCSKSGKLFTLPVTPIYYTPKV